MKINYDCQIKRANDCINKKINFISGTVTPCQSNKKLNGDICQGDIESLDVGLTYLFESYSKKLKLSIQPKFMGSRFNMYLFRDNHLEKSYCVTRNGFLCSSLNRELLNPIYDKMYKRLKTFMNEKKIKMMIIDGELLPWSALGQGLIDNEFLPVDGGLVSEIEYGEKYDFDSILEIAKNKVNALKSEKKSDYEKYKSILEMNDINTIKQMYDTYHKQMLLYTEKISDTNKIDYKPFGILKICFDDGTEDIPLISKTIGQGEMYNMLYDNTNEKDHQLIIELTPDTFNEGVIKIKDFFKKITMDNGYEGVILKPEFVEKNKLHMMKCRNIEYLTIIYGYDYMQNNKLKRLIKSKTTGSKIKQSINEFNLGIEMLKTKYDDITTDNSKYHKILMNFLCNEELGQTIDPRL